MRRAAVSLGLPNYHPAWGSVKDLSRRLPPDERFDAVVARGVGSIAHLMRLARPLLHPHGNLLLRKSPDSPEHQEAEALLASPDWAGMRAFPLPESGAKPWFLLAIERAVAA